MKSISIKELHEATGRYVRQARVEPLIVTDRGVSVAVLKALSEEDLPGGKFPRRRAAELPDVGVDSTELISRDRDGR